LAQRTACRWHILQSSGIKTPKDLDRAGGSASFRSSSGLYLWPSFAKATGIDTSKVRVLDWNFQQLLRRLRREAGVIVSGNFTLGSTGSWLFKQTGRDRAPVVFSD